MRKIIQTWWTQLWCDHDWSGKWLPGEFTQMIKGAVLRGTAEYKCCKNCDKKKWRKT